MKRVTALNREIPPPNEQFLIDFEQLKSHFTDLEQLCSLTESNLISLVVQCSGHAPRAEFLLFALKRLCYMGCINLDTFLPSLISAVSSAELSVCQGNQAMAAPISANLSQSNFHPINSPSPLSAVPGIGSPAQSMAEPSSCVALPPVTSSDVTFMGQQTATKVHISMRDSAVSSLRQLCCKVILSGLEFHLKPVTYAEIFNHILNWLVSWDKKQHGIDESESSKSWNPDKAPVDWLHCCLDVIWQLVEEEKCCVPFYELLRNGLQFIENIPDDEALFALLLEIHRRRDLLALHMQMLDQHLHCPTFGTHRFLFQSAIVNIPIEGTANVRHSPITYPSVLGEPLYGEDLASSIQRGSLDWERALRCIRHALRATPSPDWWRNVCIVARCYRNTQHLDSTIQIYPGAVFTSGMICEGTIDRIVELLKMTNSDINCWQEWLVFSDLFFFIMKSGAIDFSEFLDMMVLRLIDGDNHILRTNHVTWLLAQVIRVDLVMNALTSDTRKVETTRKMMLFHREERPSEPNLPQNVMLDFICSCQNLRFWSLNTTNKELLNNEQLQKGKQIDEWWRQVTKGERLMDYMSLDDRSIGMFWVVSYTMAQPACEMVMNWFSSAGTTEWFPSSNIQSNDKLIVMREKSPLPISVFSGFSLHSCMKLASMMEESLFNGQVVPSIAMVETYARLLLSAPHNLLRSHCNLLSQRNPAILTKPGIRILVLEVLNYRLLPLYRYHGKSKGLMYDITKIIYTMKGKRGDHRAFRLAENLCMNLILSLRDFFSVNKEAKGPTEFTETLNRLTITTLAIIIKTRGIAEADQLLHLQTMLEQILTSSQHTWSQKTLQHFPSILRDALINRIDNRSLNIQAWQQAETTVINQCKNLLPSSADPSYLITYMSHSFPQHRQYFCAGAWILMHGHPENINNANLARVLHEFSPEEVTANIYTMVDVFLYHINIELQRGHLIQDILLKASGNLGFLIWTHELLPLDILLLALIDRDDDPHALHIVISLLDKQELQQKVKLFCMNHGIHEHWLFTGVYIRNDLQTALGNYLSWKDRYPTFFDDIAARLLPIIPLIIYRLIENDAFDPAERVLVMYSQFIAHYPLRFTFVRDILAYFYGHLPGKLIFRILSVLDLNKIQFSESFPQHISSPNTGMCPPLDYFATLLIGLVNNVIPSLSCSSKSGSIGDALNASNKTLGTNQSEPTNTVEVQKIFYKVQDPGTYTQLVLETAVIELLSLPVSVSQIVSSLVQIVVHIQQTIIQSSNGLHGTLSSVGQCLVLPTSPSGGSSDSLGASRSTPIAGINTSNFVSRSGYTCQQLSCLLIQACGLLLAQLPLNFHGQLYIEASRIIKDTWWLTDGRSSGVQASAIGYALLDPSCAAQDNTSTAIGNIIALLHSFFSNLPQQWLESAHLIIRHLRPVTSIAMLRIIFRIMGPLLPRLANAHTIFNKTLALLLNTMADVFGRNSQPLIPVEASEITDIIDFLHHIVHYEGQGGAVQASSKPRAEVLVICERALENLRPDVQHLLSHLRTDPTTSIYAATHPKLVPNQP